MEHLPYIIYSGILVGIFISAPMGPIGVLVIRRTLNRGRRPGLYTGLGAAVSDLIYCLLTGFGLSFVTDFIEANKSLLQVLGSVMLMAYGIYLFMHSPRQKMPAEMVDEGNYWRDFVTGFLFTFANPLILFFIIGLFARFNFLDTGFIFYHYIAGYLAIVLGALAWWFSVTWLVNKARKRINRRTIRWINRIIASALLLMALIGIVTGVSHLVRI